MANKEDSVMMNMDYSLIILLLIVTLGCWGFWSLVLNLAR